ncbi:MAG: hypothetical protein KGD64_12865 [Candidatus Heimdallarchaeota archaeon]|nr:hypothetical protein [Candidatus Heimdallarchaeota archaeon]
MELDNIDMDLWKNIQDSFSNKLNIFSPLKHVNINLPLVDNNLTHNNKIYQDGIFIFNPSSSPKGVPFLSVDVTQLSLSYSAFNTKLEDEKSYRSFFNTRTGTDLITPHSLTSLKDRDSTMMTPSHLFKTVCELKSQNIGQLFIYGVLGNIPVFVNNKKIDFLNLSYQMFSGNESYEKIKAMIEENIYPHIHHLMDEHGIFQKIKQVPNDALATVYREVDDYKRMWVFLDLLTLTFDHAIIKSIGVNLENSLLNTKVFAKYQKLGDNSTIDRPARLRDKLPILPNFYPEVDVRIIQIVLENENLISPSTKVDFGFYASHGFESITSIPLIVYGLSKHRKKELRFVTLTDLMKKYVLIEKKLPINEQGRKLLLLNYETSSRLFELHRCQIGKEQFINIIQDQDSINYSSRNSSLCNLLVFDKNQNSFVLSDENTIISPSSFWEPIFHNNKHYLALKGEDSVPLTSILEVNNRDILPGWFDLSKGILPCWCYGKNQNNYPPETIIKHHRKTMFEFLTTRYLPVIEVHNKIKNDRIFFEIAIVHYPVDIAISKLIRLKEFIITLYKESIISNRQISGHENNKKMIEAIYQFLYDIKSLSSVATAEFDVDILLSKISETILYYDDLYRYSPHLELFVNYYEGGDKIQELFKNKMIMDSHNVPYPNPMQVVHYFTTESEVSRRYSHNLFKMYTNLDLKEKRYGKTHLAGFLANNNFNQINNNGKTYYRVNDRMYLPDALIHNPLDSIQLLLFHQRQPMKDAHEFYSKYDLGEGNILSLMATGRNEEDQIHIKELLMKSFDIINQHAKQLDHILSRGIQTKYNEKSTLYSLMNFSLKTVINLTNFDEDKDKWRFLSDKKFDRCVLQPDFIEKFTFLLKKNKLLNGLLSNNMLSIMPVSSYFRPNTPKNMLKLFALPYKFLTALTRLKEWKYPDISFISLVSGAGSRQAALVNPHLILLYEEILHDNQHKITKKLDKHIIDSLKKAILIVKKHYTEYKQISLKGGNIGEILRQEVYSKQIGDVFEIVSSLEHLINLDYLYKSQLTIGEQIIDLGGVDHPILKKPLNFTSFVVYCQNIGISRDNNDRIYNYKIISDNKTNAPFSLENQQVVKDYLYNCRILAPAGVLNIQGLFTSEIKETLVYNALLSSHEKLVEALEFAELIRNGEKIIKAHRKVYNNDNYLVSKNVSIEIIMNWRDLI